MLLALLFVSAAVNELFTAMASALSEGNVAAFMQAFDPAMPGYEKLRADAAALTARYDVATSLDFLKDEGDDDRRAVEIDWFVQLAEKIDMGRITRRRAVVRCTLKRVGKKWKVAAFDPPGLLASP